MKNCCVSACGRLTSGHLFIVSKRRSESSENTMKMHTIDGVTQVGDTKRRTTVLLGAACD